MTRGDKIRIGRHLKRKYDCRLTKYESNGRVTCYTDQMPNTNRAGRIVAGYAKELLAEAKRR